MATQPVEVEKETNEPTNLREAGSLKIGTKRFEKLGRREKGVPAEIYSSEQILESSATDVSTIVSDVLDFLGKDFNQFKSALVDGANNKRRFMDAPGLTPLEKILKAMEKSGVGMEQLLEAFSKK